ncbi:ankyrin-1-like [Triticum aestivum]|uniref:ankyrin-1-like n=1 Tax=Triticum aestivum TaxID=4565 RepID=UPI001D0177E1|nr:ankyrin-1-like [Triticum aestivum]
MGKQQQEQKTLLRAARDGSLRLLKKTAQGLASGAQGEAAVLEAVADDDGNRALHLAAREGRVEICRYLVKDLRLDVSVLLFSGGTPLFLSASSGRVAASKYLLDHGADPTLAGDFGSPLHGAAGHGHCGIVELLLSKGIDVDLECLFGTPLHAAALHKQDDVVKILLEHHADPNKFCKVGGYTPLSMAIRPTPSVSLECVKLLIKAGADVNFIDSAGVACVMVAAEYGLPGIMKCLLDAGANPNVTSRFGATPIEVAALKDRREIVEMLFPLTSPIPTLPEWSIDGIISHVKSFGLEPLDEHQYEKKKSELKLQATEAFKRNDYLTAGRLYSDAMDLDPSPDGHAILLANRSLCSLHLGDGEYALSDATMCRRLRPRWQKGCYRQGAAFMLLKDYEKAREAFADGLKLDPTSVEIASALREAREEVKKAQCAEN